ncbi:phage repressor protein C with HTH and peptisase S24 domain [Rhodoblastus acidophilus]|uniref:XRE family transcriptional regulator n=1 Tax=Rhodoblastus acidophilus TaxID=1074 RepID=UPI002225A07D|nr:LexA family transcriptional regulator [Rhodoblastus acidophilus]MCW2283360.1 phage repressor protein C with HTH and peptisase S24 domain [Rhodoblastus acidophilus]MCW2332316.1 phage repressor protein C with HTH and peptisase S24 domain [Rhodoblastus acidophilus]
MDDQWKSRLEAEMARQGLDMKALSVRAGLGETYVRDALKRGRGGSLPALNKLAGALGRSLDWLIAGKETEREPPTTRRFDTSVDRRLVDNKETQTSTIFEVDVRAGAGGGGVPIEAYVHDESGNSYAAAAVAAEWTLPETIVQGVLHSAPRHIRVFEVIGDSMEPRLYEGDRVFIDLRYTVPSPEGIFALWDGYGLVIKRLQIVMGADPMRVRIISVNSSYAPYEAGADEIRIVGRFAGRFTVN